MGAIKVTEAYISWYQSPGKESEHCRNGAQGMTLQTGAQGTTRSQGKAVEAKAIKNIQREAGILPNFLPNFKITSKFML